LLAEVAQDALLQALFTINLLPQRVQVRCQAPHLVLGPLQIPRRLWIHLAPYSLLVTLHLGCRLRLVGGKDSGCVGVDTAHQGDGLCIASGATRCHILLAPQGTRPSADAAHTARRNTRITHHERSSKLRQ